MNTLHNSVIARHAVFSLLFIFCSVSLSGAAGTGTQQWVYQLGGDVYSVSVSNTGSTVYAGSVDEKVYALDSGGNSEWEYKTDGEIYSRPGMADDGSIYFGSNDKYVYGLNSDGSDKWKQQTGGSVSAGPKVADDGTVYVGSHDYSLYAFEADGTPKWTYPTGGIIRSAVAIDTDGTVYVGSGDNKLYALFPDGTSKWIYDAATGSIRTAPAVDTTKKVVYVGSDDNYLHAVNTDDGSAKWTFPTGDQVRSSPAVATDGTVYVGSDDTYVYAVNPDGTEKWKYQAGTAVDLAIDLASDGTVLVAVNDTINGLDAATGTLSWSYKAAAEITTDPAAYNDLVYFGAKDEQVYAVAAPVTASASTTEVTLASPADNDVLDYAGTQGQLTFSFFEVASADTYTLHLTLFEILSGTEIPVAVPLVPGQTADFTQSGTQWSYSLLLDQSQWESLASYDLTWGVEALDSSGDVIASSQVSGVWEKYVNGLKLAAGFGIPLTSPSYGSTLYLSDPAPAITWDDYTGVAGYTLVMAHMENGTFDDIFTKDYLAVSSYTLTDSEWQGFTAGTWYWTVLGYNSLGSSTPPGFTLMKFTLSGQSTSGTGFSISESSVSMQAGESKVLSVSNGSGFYNVNISDPAVADASFAGDTVTISGLAAGSTDVTISDSDGNSAVVSVTVN